MYASHTDPVQAVAWLRQAAADVEAARKLLADGGVLACHDLGEDCCCPGVRAALDALFPAGPDEQVDTLAIYREVA